MQRVQEGKMEKSESSQFMKRTLLQFLVSVSLFSLILCYSLGFFFFQPVSFHVYLSSLAFSFFTHTIDRKYMFLVCNGILVFLAKRSASIPASSPLSDLITKSSATADQVITSVEEDQQVNTGSADDDHDVVAIQEEDQERHQEEEEVGEKSEDLIEGEDKERDESSSPNEEVLSTDELNKKFEEFIRKMKEEIRIEAQQQLVAV